MRLGLDLDGCVFCWDRGARLALQMYRGSDIPVRESLCWDEIEQQCEPADWRWTWGEGVRRGYELAPVYPGVVESLHRMQKRGLDIVVITHRPRTVADVTLRRLGELGLWAIEVHHMQDGDKSDIVCDVYVDDKPENVKTLAKFGTVFMPRRPYNTELHLAPWWSGTIRPYDRFTEVEEYIRAQY